MAVESPAAPMTPPAKASPRKTRTPDWLTDFVLVITGVFGVWAVALVVLTFIGHRIKGAGRNPRSGSALNPVVPIVAREI